MVQRLRRSEPQLGRHLPRSVLRLSHAGARSAMKVRRPFLEGLPASARFRSAQAGGESRQRRTFESRPRAGRVDGASAPALLPARMQGKPRAFWRGFWLGIVTLGLYYV